MKKRLIIIFFLIVISLTIIGIVMLSGRKPVLINLSHNIAFDAYPAVSPDGSKVAFISDRDGNYELYIMDIDGNNQTRLTHNSVAEKSPSWNPDGKSIVFVSERGGDNDIYKIDLNTLEIEKVFSSSFDPQWSPDGSMIAFSSLNFGEGTSADIYIKAVYQDNPINLTDTPSFDTQPSWSPDGKKIAFISNRDENFEVYSMTVDGTYQTNLSKNPAEEASPCWSGDGKKIAFVSTRDGNHEIYIMKADGTNPERLTDNPAKDLWPSWMPDDSGIVFYSKRDGNGEIYLMELEKGLRKELKDRWNNIKKMFLFKTKEQKKDLSLEKEEYPITDFAKQQKQPMPPKAEKSPESLEIDIFKQGFRYVPQGFPYGKGVSQSNVHFDSVYHEELIREPEYKTSSPLYGYILLGNGSDKVISCVIDGLDSKEPLLYIDSNNNEDLTDDAGPLRNKGTGKLACYADIMVSYQAQGIEQSQPYRIWIFIKTLENGKIIGNFYAACYYEGSIKLGKRQYPAFVFDENGDGLYSDNGVYIDLDRDNLFSDKTERFMQGDILKAEGRIYKITQLSHYGLLGTVAFGENDKDILKEYVSESFGIRFKYPAKFLIGKYKTEVVELSEAVKASGQEPTSVFFKNNIVLVEPAELGERDINSIPVGEVATISLDLKQGPEFQFYKENFCREEWKEKIGKHTVYRLPGAPGPYGEKAFYYLIVIDNRILEITAHKGYLRDVEKYVKEGKPLPSTHYDKDIELIIASLEIL